MVDRLRSAKLNLTKFLAVARETSGAAAAVVDQKIPVLFLLIALVMGTLYAFVMPPMQVPDEMMHFARAHSVSQGVCIASPDIDMPKSFSQLNDLFPHWMEKRRKISITDLHSALRIPLNDHDMAGDGRERSLAGFINQNVYHCMPYLPEAAVLNVGRRADLSPLVLMYLCRMTNLIAYTLLTFLALRLLPDFRMVLFSAALMPMALHQAASVSADATIIAVSFLFTAYVFRLALGKDPERLGPCQHLNLTLLILFLVLSKTMVSCVFLLLLIPTSKFACPRNRWAIVGGYMLFAVACAAIWLHVNEPNMQRQAEERLLRWRVGLEPVDVAANMRFIREHPVELATIFLRSVGDLRYLYFNLQGFVGVLGWESVYLPDSLVLLYFATLIASAATQTRATKLTPLMRWLIMVFIACAVANTLATGWIVETPKAFLARPEMWERVRIYAQGRYWVPFALPIFVLFSTGRTRFNPGCFAGVAVAVVVAATAVALYMVKITYYC